MTQATMAQADDRSRPMTSQERRVVLASSAGTIFEWYDFYLYGSLASIIAKNFFSNVNPTAAYIFALLAFAAGFAVRPFGAVVFGRLGDLVGRKYTFLLTILIMGLSTFLVGLLPNYHAIGITAPILLVLLRLAQGLALGGEYGGAAIFVGEHSPQRRRGYYTSWIQTTATLGLLLSLVVILFFRYLIGEADFEVYGWRFPFLISFVLLVASVWMRLQLSESPAFKQMKKLGRGSLQPVSEAFGTWRNAKIALIALFGGTAGQAVVWYTSQFYALFFLTADAQSRRDHRQPAGRGLAHPRRAVFRVFRLVFRSHRPQADHSRRLPSGRPALLPDLQGPDLRRQPRAGAGAGDVAGPGDGRSRQMHLPVRSDRQRRIRDLLRSRQEYSGQCGRELFQRSRAGRCSGADPDRRQGDRRRSTAPASPGTRCPRSAPRFEAEVTSAIQAAGYPRVADPAQINKPLVLGLLSATGHSGDHELWPDRRATGRTLPDPHPLHRRCRCPITSAMAGSAASCRPSPSPWSRPAAIFISACGIRSAWRS